MSRDLSVFSSLRTFLVLSPFESYLLSRGAGHRYCCYCLGMKGQLKGTMLLLLEQLRSSSSPRASFFFSSSTKLCKRKSLATGKTGDNLRFTLSSIARWYVHESLRS